MCSPCLLLLAHVFIIGFYTLTPVIHAPTLTGIIVHFFLSVACLAAVAGLLSQNFCFAGIEGVCWVFPVTHCSLVVRVMSLLSLSTSNSCFVDQTLTLPQASFQRNMHIEDTALAQQQHKVSCKTCLSCLFFFLVFSLFLFIFQVPGIQINK